MAEHDLKSIAFPTLDAAQIARLSGCVAAVSRSFDDGQRLFSVGDYDPKFFVVKSGQVDIIDSSGGEPRRLTVHHQGQFTGDVSHLTGTPAVVSAIARGPCEVYEISGDALRRVLNQCPDLGDVILQAFIFRPPAAPAPVARLHRPARHRFALLRGHSSCPRVPGEEPLVQLKA